MHPVTRSPCPEPIAFLDGTQRYEVVSYVGTSPVVAALIGAAVRLRVDGQFRTVAHDGGRLLIGAPNALAAFADRLPDFGRVELDLDGPVHPLEELEKAHRAVDDYRSALEWRVAAQFRRDDPSWLVVDGVLPHFDRLGSDPRVIGVSKSHATLPFDDPETSHLYLSLPQGTGPVCSAPRRPTRHRSIPGRFDSGRTRAKIFSTAWCASKSRPAPSGLSTPSASRAGSWPSGPRLLGPTRGGTACCTAWPRSNAI